MADRWEPIGGATPHDLSHLKDRSITTRAALDRAEGENVRKAHVQYLAGKPSRRLARFQDFSWYLKLHREMFGDVWEYAGQTRTADLNIGVAWHDIVTQMQRLLEDLVFWSGEAEMSFIEQSARVHHKAVYIHPFWGGNGRWSRMLANIWLRQNDQPLVAWPEETLGAESKIRGEYIGAVKSADCGDYRPLTTVHSRYTEQPV